MRCGYEVVAYLNVIITGSDFIACKEQMATLAALTHHSVCLPGSAAPVGAGAFVLKTQTQAGLQPCSCQEEEEKERKKRRRRKEKKKKKKRLQ
uniref:Uncharacterized protein n=1 Tax=Mustela putorius furo TaxID=9669 RepID=M3YQ74_MUSPF